MSHLRPPAPLRALQRELSIAAAGSADLRFDDLLSRAAEPEILQGALRVVTARKGGNTAGPDGLKPSAIEPAGSIRDPAQPRPPQWAVPARVLSSA